MRVDIESLLIADFRVCNKFETLLRSLESLKETRDYWGLFIFLFSSLFEKYVQMHAQNNCMHMSGFARVMHISFFVSMCV